MQNATETLDWPRIHGELCKRCTTALGELAAESLSFATETSIVRERLEQLKETIAFRQQYGDPPPGALHPILSALSRLTKGGFLEATEAGQLLESLQTAHTWAEHLRASSITPFPMPENPRLYLAEKIFIDGTFPDSASDTLGQLRHTLQRHRETLYRQLNAYLHNPSISKALQEPIITEREGRTVLPVRVEMKASVPGIVHATSSSGSTLYIEPAAVVDLNNQLQSLQSAIQKEIDRLLREIADRLRPDADFIRDALVWMGEWDCLLAKARLAQALHAEIPTLVETQETVLLLKQARHPMLVLAHRETPEVVVGNDIILGSGGNRVMVITGPNTGGKTVLLKTVGLLMLMIQAGLAIPVAEGSQLSLLNPVLVDIGDQQDLSQNLSTFSAHLAQMRTFLSHGTALSQSLILIDEIAAGTDPAEGAALARALLEAFHTAGALVMVTTHIGELKVVAHQTSGFQNASMLFNPETLTPMYRLVIGTPGSSHALTIAQKLGLPLPLLERAKAYMSAPESQSADLIETLETQNRQLLLELSTAQKLREEAQITYAQLQREKDTLASKKSAMLEHYQDRLRSRLYTVEATLNDLQQLIKKPKPGALRHATRRLREISTQSSHVFREEEQALFTHEAPVSYQTLKVGQELYSKQYQVKATIVELHGAKQEVTLRSGILKFTVPATDLLAEEPGFARSSKPRHPVPQRPIKNTQNSAVPLSPKQCDLRGQRVNDALETVAQFLDAAVLSGWDTVDIIHGLGTGALKKAIRAQLANNPAVKSFTPAPASDGGDGKTLVNF